MYSLCSLVDNFAKIGDPNSSYYGFQNPKLEIPLKIQYQ